MRKFMRLCAYLLILALAGATACDQSGSGGTSDSADIAEQLRQTMDVLDQSLPDGEIDMAHRQVRQGMQNPDADLLLFPITETQKANYEKQTGKPWTPLAALQGLEDGPPPASFEVRQMTEVWAVYVDRESKHVGKPVVFSWLYGLQNESFADPVASVVTKYEGYPFPVAWSYAWSDPANSSRLIRGLGLRSLTSSGNWAQSRCYGPRTVRVAELSRMAKVEGDDDDKPKLRPVPAKDIISESGIDLLEPDVQVVTQ